MSCARTGSPFALRLCLVLVPPPRQMLFELAARVELPANGSLWHDLRQRCRDFVQLAPPCGTQPVDLERLTHQMMDPAPDQRPTAANLLAVWQVAAIVGNTSVRTGFSEALAASTSNRPASALGAARAGGGGGRASPLAFELGRTRSFAAQVSLETMQDDEAEGGTVTNGGGIKPPPPLPPKIAYMLWPATSC